MQSSSGRTKILPSPISPVAPVRPPLMMALIVGSTKSSFTAIMQLHFAQQIDRDLLAAIDLGLPLLPAEALAVHDREPHDLDLREGGLHVFELAGLDDGDDELHGEESGCRSRDAGDRPTGRRVIVSKQSLDPNP